MRYQTERFKKTSWSKLFTQGYDDNGEDGKEDNDMNNKDDVNDKDKMNGKDNLL